MPSVIVHFASSAVPGADVVGAGLTCGSTFWLPGALLQPAKTATIKKRNTRRIIRFSSQFTNSLFLARGVFHDLRQKVIRFYPCVAYFRSEVDSETLTESPQKRDSDGV